MASVPDLKRLWSEGRTNPLGKQVWKLGICPSMLGDADALDAAATARRDTVQERVVAYNKVLREVCAKDRRCRFDGGAVFDYRFDRRPVEPLGLVPPEQERPGAAGGDRLPQGHGAAAGVSSGDRDRRVPRHDSELFGTLPDGTPVHRWTLERAGVRVRS